jgi:UDP-3-O-[3-hydroxymyristoyl] glucosamine N-acyltransferase
MPRLSQLAELVNGNLRGNDHVISDAKTIARAGTQDVTFVTDPSNFEPFLQSDSPAAFVSNSVLAESTTPIPDSKSIVEVENAETAFTTVVKQFRGPTSRARIGVSPSAHVDPSVTIADDVDIYPGAFVGANVQIGSGSTIFPGACLLENCIIGSNVRIYPNAVLYENTKVGDDSIVHAGSVLGAFGFGYKSSSSGHELSAQLGNVEVGVKVELGANTTIDRGTFDSTVVGDGTKMDNLVMVGHNCEIGKHNLLCSQVGIAGSCTTGDFVVMAGQVGIGDHLNIGDRSILMAKSGVMHDIPTDKTYLGIPAVPVREQMQIFAVTAKLPEMRKSVKRLTKRIDAIENANAASESRDAA